MNAGTPSLSSGHLFFNGMSMPSGYGHQSQMPTLSLLTPPGNKSQPLASAPADYHVDLRKNSNLTLEIDSQLGVHPITAMENPLLSSDRRLVHNEDILRAEKKRKVSAGTGC